MSKVTLCGASAYEQKYYFNQDFQGLPQAIKEELQIMCVTFTEKVGGVLTLEYGGDGRLRFQVRSLESDGMFDEIGSELEIKRLRQEKEELLEGLEVYYKIVILKETEVQAD